MNIMGNKVLDPQGSFLQSWNKIFLLFCIIAVALDPLFFYIPVVVNDGTRKCLSLDKRLAIIACVLRTFIDAFYIIHMIFQFRTAFIAASSRVFGRGVLIVDLRTIAKRYLFTYVIIDFLAILPLPQLVILLIVTSLKDQPVAFVTKESLKYIIICQYVPRIVRIFPLYTELTGTSVIGTENAGAVAAFNLFICMLASHFLGAIWYLISVERQERCWGDVAIKHGHNRGLLYCNDDKDPRRTDNLSNPDLLPLLNTYCSLINPDDITNSTVFNFGIFTDALQSGIVATRDFPKKFFYCFWWGLRNLSSLGQNMKTSTFVGEIIFAVVTSIVGLFLFAILIGSIQPPIAVKVEEMKVKRTNAEQWMKHRKLPMSLRARIRQYGQYGQYKRQETGGVEEESLIRCLPRDLGRDIKRHLCLDLLMRVPMFEKMDEQLLDTVCDRLKRVLYTEKGYIVRKGGLVEEMLFIIQGNLVSTATNGGITGFFNDVYLKAGDFCGEALLTWALDPQSSSHLPISTRTVKALSEVEAFALLADDLKFIASQYRRLHSKQLQHTFRFHSVQWKTWAASFIQAAWRRCCRRKFLKSLRGEEARLQNALADDSGISASVGASIYVSRFAANALRNVRQDETPTPRMLPQKPAEPDFTAYQDQ